MNHQTHNKLGLIVLFILSVTAFGCAKTSNKNGNNPGVDMDGDGITVAEGDCNDNNPDIHPDAEEICDGVDNNCDGNIDGIQRDCYEGPDETKGVGTCTSGTSICELGIWQTCQNQVLPENEICGDNKDNDCDGEEEETCSDTDCNSIVLDSELEITNTCISLGTNAKLLLQLTLVNSDGEPMTEENVRFTIGDQNQHTEIDTTENNYFAGFTPRANTGEHEVRAHVACGGNTEVTLNANLTLTVVENAGPYSGHLISGGCSPRQGNLKVTVIDANTQAPIEQAYILAGNIEEASFHSDPSKAIQGIEVEDNNITRTDENGQAFLIDYSGNFNEDMNITVSAAGYQTLTIAQNNSSEIFVSLKPIDLEIPEAVTWQGSFENFSNLDSDGFGTAGIAVLSRNLNELLQLGFSLGNHFQYSCWNPIELEEESPFSDILGNQLISSNLVIPAQTEDANTPASNPPEQPLDIQGHRFQLKSYNSRPRKIVAVEARFNISEVIQLFVNPDRYSLEDIAAAIEFKKTGLLSVTPDGEDELSIELEETLTREIPCNVSNPPEGMSVLCIAGGDFSESDFIEDIFPLSATFFSSESLAMEENNSQSKNLVIPSNPQEESLFSNLKYRGVALAVSTSDDSVKPKSIIIDRKIISDEEEGINANHFLNIPNLAYDSETHFFSWENVATNQSPNVNYCRLGLERLVYDFYTPNCKDLRSTRIAKQSVIWESFIDGSSFNEFTLPNAANQMPNIADDGDVDNQWDIFMIQCFGGSDEFSFNNGNFTEAKQMASHISLDYDFY